MDGFIPHYRTICPLCDLVSEALEGFAPDKPHCGECGSSCWTEKCLGTVTARRERFPVTLFERERLRNGATIKELWG